MDREALRLIEQLGLVPHPEGGHYREFFRSTVVLSTARGTRSASTGVWFLLPVEASSRRSTRCSAQTRPGITAAATCSCSTCSTSAGLEPSGSVLISLPANSPSRWFGPASFKQPSQRGNDSRSARVSWRRGSSLRTSCCRREPLYLRDIRKRAS